MLIMAKPKRAIGIANHPTIGVFFLQRSPIKGTNATYNAVIKPDLPAEVVSNPIC